jgi:hypothetical protein
MLDTVTPSAGTVAQRARWDRQHAASVPVKPDPDVFRLMAAFRTSYGKAKLLKALSFGLPVDQDIMAWCMPTTSALHNVVSKLRDAHPSLLIEPTVRDGSYIIRDAATLARLRAIINGEP